MTPHTMFCVESYSHYLTPAIFVKLIYDCFALCVSSPTQPFVGTDLAAVINEPSSGLDPKLSSMQHLKIQLNGKSEKLHFKNLTIALSVPPLRYGRNPSIETIAECITLNCQGRIGTVKDTGFYLRKWFYYLLIA